MYILYNSILAYLPFTFHYLKRLRKNSEGLLFPCHVMTILTTKKYLNQTVCTMTTKTKKETDIFNFYISPALLTCYLSKQCNSQI